MLLLYTYSDQMGLAGMPKCPPPSMTRWSVMIQLAKHFCRYYTRVAIALIKLLKEKPGIDPKLLQLARLMSNKELVMQAVMIACIGRFFLTQEMLWAEGGDGMHATVMAARIVTGTKILTRALNSRPHVCTPPAPPLAVPPAQTTGTAPIAISSAVQPQAESEASPPQPAPTAACLSSLAATTVPVPCLTSPVGPECAASINSVPITSVPYAQPDAVPHSSCPPPQIPCAVGSTHQPPATAVPAAAPTAASQPQTRTKPKRKARRGNKPYFEMYSVGESLGFSQDQVFDIIKPFAAECLRYWLSRTGEWTQFPYCLAAVASSDKVAATKAAKAGLAQYKSVKGTSEQLKWDTWPVFRDADLLADLHSVADGKACSPNLAAFLAAYLGCCPVQNAACETSLKCLKGDQAKARNLRNTEYRMRAQLDRPWDLYPDRSEQDYRNARIVLDGGKVRKISAGSSPTSTISVPLRVEQPTGISATAQATSATPPATPAAQPSQQRAPIIFQLNASAIPTVDTPVTQSTPTVTTTEAQHPGSPDSTTTVAVTAPVIIDLTDQPLPPSSTTQTGIVMPDTGLHYELLTVHGCMLTNVSDSE